jgi:hypothetical protein
MDDCEKMRMFIDDNYAMEYIIWENAIYNQLKNKQDDNTSISDIDFDIVD